MKYEKQEMQGINENYFLCHIKSKKKEEKYDPNIYTINKEVTINNKIYYITKIEFSIYTEGKETGNFKIFKLSSDNLYEEETDPIIRLELSNYI